ncbi:MAG: tetratricopeptide repeat protein [Pirellulaceae bacterium]
MQFDDVTRAYARDLGRQEIERAFAQFGIEPNHQSPFEAADFCCSIPTIYRNDIVEAIHFWITESRPQLRNRTVEEIDVGSIAWWIDFLNAFDPDPWRINVRSALIANDHTKLASLVSGESSEIDLQLPFTRLLIADALSRMGQGSLAVAELKDAQRKFSNNAWLTQYLGKALMYEDEKDFAAAARYLTAAVSLSPENSMMHEALGEALYQTGNFRDAADQFRHALIISPKFVQAKQWLANSLIESGDFDEATAHLDAVLLECPEMSEAWTTKAILEQRLGNQTEAETSFRKASELKPNDDDLHLNLLSFLETSGQIPRAVEHLRKLIDSNRNSVTWNRYLGHLLLRDKRADEAIVFLDLVAKLDTEDFESHYDLGLAHHYAGNYSIALECYKRAKQLNPDNDKVNLAIESAQRG